VLDNAEEDARDVDTFLDEASLACANDFMLVVRKQMAEGYRKGSVSRTDCTRIDAIMENCVHYENIINERLLLRSIIGSNYIHVQPF